ncbi:GIY-YIG nuclease family protein [Gracilimonas sp.]|uniref:GIY-YIG nuclease family protein n=1 Tax=Gracilimonas sp. TaxID=1974203 RepID=UPI003D0BFF4C
MKEIIVYLHKDPKLYKDVKVFSTKPGIYAFFYLAKTENGMFPIESGKLIYIGKTESSQRKRDANTHFKSGKTGSSTFRKSIGSVLINELTLVPIPRNSSDFKKGRTSMFKFDERSEEKLTGWMKDHIAMTFYEFEGDKSELDVLETQIIHELTPPLLILAKTVITLSRRIFKGCERMLPE